MGEGLVLGFDREQPVGTIVQGNLAVGDIDTDQPFFILRPATKEEWRRSAIESGCDPQRVHDETGYSHFYEVTTD